MTGNNLKIYLDDFFDMLELYRCSGYRNDYKDILKANIDLFLENNTSYNALAIYETFFMIYDLSVNDESQGKYSFYELSPVEVISMNNQTSENTDKNPYFQKEPNIPLNFAKLMIKYGENSDSSSLNDISIHSVNVFLLGLAIYSQNKNYRKLFKNYIESSKYTQFYKTEYGELSHEEFLYRWGITSLFHDIARPIEYMSKPLKNLLNKDINSFNNQIGDISFDFVNLKKLNSINKISYDFTEEYNARNPTTNFLDLFKSTNILSFKIAYNFKLNIEQLNLLRDSLYKDYIIGDCPSKGPIFIDYGLISALTVLKLYGFLIQKYSKNHDFFFYPIVDSASAILLHNYYRNVLQKQFKLKDLHPSQSPLAFLLILCDELQEWNRQPFGIKDKQKGCVNELLLKIDDYSLDVHYIVKSGSMGLGFSEDKEKLLNNVLSIRSAFRFGLRIITDVKQYFTLNEGMQDSSQAPDILLRNVENLAILIHNHYNKLIEKQYREKIDNGEEIDEDFQMKYDEMKSFDELTPQLKIANIRQARSIPIKLYMIGCELASKSDEREAITEFSTEEVEDLAIFEHDEWCEEKEGTGWVYGEEKDVENLVTPYLVPWDDLTEEIREFDRETVREIPSLIQSIGLKVVRSKIWFLTIEMHNLHNNTSFDELPDYIKYSNYKQADYLIKILSQRGYSVVDVDSPGKAVEGFDPDSIDYFAEREHEAWYKLKVNLGWTYGSVKDDISKTNPNLVDWNALDYEKKEANRLTFKTLPDLCKKVDLKIVKN